MEGLEAAKPPLALLPRFVFAVVLPLSVCPPLSRCLCTSCWLLLPFLAASVFLSLPLSGLGCAVRAVIVCLCVISCLNEGQVNEINFSCPYMGIALTDSRIVRLCLSVCVCHVAPRLPAHVHPQACTACEAVAPPLSCVATFASAQLQKHFKSFIHLLKQLLKKKESLGNIWFLKSRVTNTAPHAGALLTDHLRLYMSAHLQDYTICVKLTRAITFSNSWKIHFNLKSYCIFTFWIDTHS